MTDPNLVFISILLLTGVFSGLALFSLFLHRRYGKVNEVGSSVSRWKKGVILVLWNLSVSCFALLMIILCFEAYFRFFRDTTDSFDHTLVSRRWFARHYHRNAQNVRDNVDYVFPATPGKRRVTFFGDSFTAGHGVTDVDDRFVNRLRLKHPGWEVHFIGEVGGDTGAHLQDARNLLQFGYHFDEVVLVYCLNDIGDLLSEWQDTSQRLLAEMEKEEAANIVLRGSYFINTMYYRYKSKLSPDIVNYGQSVLLAYRENLWNVERRRLQEFRHLVETIGGGHLTVVVFPFFNVLGSGYPFNEVHKQLVSFWQGQGVPRLDLLPVYSGYSGKKLVVNSMDAHPNELAHKLAAEAINDFLAVNMRHLNTEQ